MYVRRNNDTRSCNHCYGGIAMSSTYSECVSVTLDIQHAVRMRRILLMCVVSQPQPNISTVSHKRYDFRKNFIALKYVFYFLYNFRR